MSAEAQVTYTDRERTFVAWSAILGYAFDFYNLIIMAFLLVPIQKSLNIGLPDTGLIVAATLAASVFGGILFGWLGDRIGRKKALLATLLLLAAGSLFSALSWSFASLLIFRVITGIGVGGEWGAGMVLLNEVWDNRRRGFGSSVVQAMSSAGTALASIAATVALANLDPDMAWRVAFAIGGLPLLLMLFVRSKMPELRLWLEYQRRLKTGELPPEKLAESSPLIEIFKGAAGKYFILGIIVAGGYIINYQSISIFMPTLMLRDLGTPLAALRSATLVFAAVSAVGMIVDRIDQRCLGPAALGAAVDAGRHRRRGLHLFRGRRSLSRRAACRGRCSGPIWCGASDRARSASSARGSPSFIRSRCARPRRRPFSPPAG